MALAALVLAALTAGLGGLFTVVGEIATAVLATFLARLGGALRVVGEVAAALLAALVACLGGALRVVGEVAAAVLAAFLAGFEAFFGSLAKLPGFWFCAMSELLPRLPVEPHKRDRTSVYRLSGTAGSCHHD
ncbi:hypothetical protein [Halomonas sp. E19]|uniref:hypothetical protein n=1 Tax=Halomonas sp. E19 TaxID=3397247 RepID=UPI004033242D